MMSFFDGLQGSGQVSLDRSKNVLGGAAPFYRTYLCKDGREVAVGPLEPKFYQMLLDAIGAPADFLVGQHDPATWSENAECLEAIFLQRDMADWAGLFEGTDACLSPVLRLNEVTEHPHMQARSAFVVKDGLKQTAPVPRFSRTPGAIQNGKTAEQLLQSWRHELAVQESWTSTQLTEPLL
jgi:alpha-methylacyl-CoA racemase